jgi:ActR/RegA family two-component response regulator
VDVLLVEDDEHFADSLILRLARRGFAVRHEVTALAAVTAAQKQLPEAVVLDLILPDGSGLEFLHKFREMDADIPVVILTAYESLESAKEAINGGATAYMSKADLEIETLASVLRSSVARCQEIKSLREVVTMCCALVGGDK